MSENLPTNERPAESRPGSMPGIAWGGVALIGIGVIFLLKQMGFLPGDFNWWALFILMPAVAIFYRAWQTYQQTERFDRRTRSMVIGGSIITLVAVIFLFNLSWSLMWPVFLIVAGIGALINAAR